MRRHTAPFFWLLLAALTLPAAAAAPQTRPATPRPAAVVELRGEINNYSRDLFERRVNQARQQGATVIIIDLDTYGGVATSGLEISQFIKQHSDLHTIAFVNPKAYSAGAMIAVACNEIVVSPVAFLGDCAPISVGPTGLQPLPDAERAKAESPILADFRDSAMRNGYDPLLLESMVTVGRTVHWIEKNGQRRFVNAEQYTKLTPEGWTPVDGVADPVDAGNTLLTVSTDTAIKLGLAKGIAANVSELALQHNLNIVGTYQTSPGEQIVRFLNTDIVRGLLLTIFLTTLYAAFHAPGHGMAEVTAMVTLAALLGVPLLTGYATWWEILAVLLGIALLAVELFVIPGFGVVGLTGIVLILGGLILTFAAPEPGNAPGIFPSLPVTWKALENGLLVVVVGLFASFMLSWWLRQYLPKMPYFNRLILTTVVGSESGMVGSLTNIDPSEQSPAVGAIGLAMTDLCPGGLAQFRDPAGGTHVVSVVSDSGFVPRGAPLTVYHVEGNRIVVRPTQDSALSTQD
jgi:membrane-bound serine protease (ClpP class)